MSKKSRNNANLVRSSEGEKTVLTVYQGFGVVQQTRPLHLKDGANEIQLQGMPSQYLPSTLVVLDFQGIGSFTLGPVSYQQPNFTAAAILQRSVGKKVNLKIRSNSGRQRSIEGTLQAVLGCRKAYLASCRWPKASLPWLAIDGQVCPI